MLLVAVVEFDGRLLARAQLHVDELDAEREGHREVHVRFVNVLPHALGNEKHADEQKEAQRQDAHARVLIDKPSDRSGKQEHDENGDDDGRRHDDEVLRHADGGDDRVERKDDVEQNDLYDGESK